MREPTKDEIENLENLHSEGEISDEAYGDMMAGLVVDSSWGTAELESAIQLAEIENREKLSRLKDALTAVGHKKRGMGKEIAEKTGYTVSSVSNMLNGKVPLSDKFIKLICANFGINEDYVFRGEEYPVFAEVETGKGVSFQVKDEDRNSFEEGLRELQKMTGAKLRRAVAMLMDMNEEK
jgi:transcriptional regulator with XRE-family HTH domain